MKEYEIIIKNKNSRQQYKARAINTTITYKAHKNGTYQTKSYSSLKKIAQELATFIPLEEEFFLYEETGRYAEKISSDKLMKLKDLVIKEHKKLSMSPDKV